MSAEIDREIRLGVSVIGDKELEALFEVARASSEKMVIETLHKVQDERFDRLVRAMLPEAYVRPYKHAHAGDVEMFVPLTGLAELVTFDAKGGICGRVLLKRGVVCDVESDVYHTVVARTPFAQFELTTHGLAYGVAKERLYAPWAPAKGDTKAEAYRRNLSAKLKIEETS